MGKKKVKKGAVNELFDLEIDEVSTVDSPAIGESFYITKSINNKKGAKVAKGKKLPLIKAMPKWSEGLKKNEDTCGDHCHFCGITKQVEEETMGAGLRNGVCLGCALEHYEKGVFDKCLELAFDIEDFKKKFPDVKLHQTEKADEDESDDDSDEDDSKDDEGKKDDKKDDKKEGDEADSDEDEDDSDEDDSKGDEEDDSKKSTEKPASVDNKKGSTSSESGNDDLSKRIETVEKSLEDVSDMLERSLELHSVAGDALSEVVALTFASLDMLMIMIEERMEEDGEQAKTQSSLFSEINESIKSVRLDVSKAGAKISGKRMAVLREIASKLSELIESVMGIDDSKKGVTKSAISEVQKSLESFKDEIKEEISSASSSLKKDIDERLKQVNTKLEDIELSGGTSLRLDDDEEFESDTDKDVEKGESVFSGLLGVEDIKKSIERKKRNLNR